MFVAFTRDYRGGFGGVPLRQFCITVEMPDAAAFQKIDRLFSHSSHQSVAAVLGRWGSVGFGHLVLAEVFLGGASISIDIQGVSQARTI